MDTPVRHSPIANGMRFFTIGGGVISFAAGIVNAVTMLSVFGISSTHMTGMLTQLAVEGVGAEHTLPFAHVAGVGGAFVFGAAISGAVLQSSRLRVSHRYGVLLFLEGCLLLYATWLLTHNAFGGVALAAMATGLQNALATQYSGAILRTTHITGVITDVGVAIGRFLRGRTVEGWRVYLHLVILLGFGSGSVLGALAFMRVGPMTMCVPAVIILACSIVYWRKRASLDHASEEIIEG